MGVTTTRRSPTASTINGGDETTTVVDETDPETDPDTDADSTSLSTSKSLSVVDANRGEPEVVDEGFPTWAIVVIVVVGMICLICVLYFVAFASLPPRQTGDDKEMQELITELESKHPDVDFEALKAQIYAELPRDASAIQQTYGNLNAVEAQRIVDEAVKMHDTAPRHSFFNPPFRGMFTRNYGKAPTAPPSSDYGGGSASSAYGGMPLSSNANQYGIFPARPETGTIGSGSYGGVPTASKPAPVPRPLPSMPASSSQYGLLSARSPRDE